MRRLALPDRCQALVNPGFPQYLHSPHLLPPRLLSLLPPPCLSVFDTMSLLPPRLLFSLTSLTKLIWIWYDVCYPPLLSVRLPYPHLYVIRWDFVRPRSSSRRVTQFRLFLTFHWSSSSKSLILRVRLHLYHMCKREGLYTTILCKMPEC